MLDWIHIQECHCDIVCFQLSTYAGVLCTDGDQLLFGLRVFSGCDTSVP